MAKRLFNIPDGTLYEGIHVVVWLDSKHKSGWNTDEPETEPLTCVSTGMLVRRAKDAVTLCLSTTVEDDPQRCGEMTIPTCSIVKMERLKIAF